jgi:hypothetical protein
VKIPKALGVSMSGFYTWKKSPISERETQKKASLVLYTRKLGGHFFCVNSNRIVLQFFWASPSCVKKVEKQLDYGLDII